MKKLGIYGSGGLGREVLELAKIINSENNRWDEIIFIDDFRSETQFKSLSVFSYDKMKERFTPADIEIVIGIGEPEARRVLAEKILHDGYELATLIHPNVHIPESTKIGCGSVICSSVFVSCEVAIGQNVYIIPHVNVGHETIIDDNSVIAGFANIAGSCCIGKNTFIGMSSCVKEKTNIGNDSVVGMGSVVAYDIPPGVIALGNPARSIMKNDSKKVFK